MRINKTNKMDRREFITTISTAYLGTILMPHLLFSQQENNEDKGPLEKILENKNLTWKEKEMYENLNMMMNSAIQDKGNHPLNRCRLHLKFNDDEAIIRIKPEYISKIPKRLRMLVYLFDEDQWYSSTAIHDLKLCLYSKHETKISYKIHELNLNQHRKRSNYWEIRNRRLEGNQIYKKMEKGLYTISSKLKIKKKDIKEVLWAMGYLQDMKGYDLKEKLGYMGNLIAEDHVWLSEIKYDGFPSFLWQADVGVRVPKLLDIKISRGEESIVGYALSVRCARFPKNRLLTKKELSKRAGVFVPFDLKKFIGKSK